MRGVIQCENLRLKRYNAVETCKANDEIGFKLAHYLERMGYEAVIVHADLPVDAVSFNKIRSMMFQMHGSMSNR